MMHHKMNREQAERSGLYLAVTGMPVQCENPVCVEQAIVRDQATGAWLCQTCMEALYDAKWGLGT